MRFLDMGNSKYYRIGDFVTELKINKDCFHIAVWNTSQSRGILIEGMSHPVAIRVMDHRAEILDEVQTLRVGIERLTETIGEYGDGL